MVALLKISEKLRLYSPHKSFSFLVLAQSKVISHSKKVKNMLLFQNFENYAQNRNFLRLLPKIIALAIKLLSFTTNQFPGTTHCFYVWVSLKGI